MNKLLEHLIIAYSFDRKKVERLPNEIENFSRFFVEFGSPISEDKYKYNQYTTLGLAFIRQHRNEIYRRIREAVRSVHNRSKNNTSFNSGKTPRSRRRRAW